MWSTLKISSGAQLGHDKRDIPVFDTVLFHSNLSSLRRRYWTDVPTDKIVLSSGPKISKRPLKRRHWWLKNKERKCHFRFVERRFLAAINCTGSAEGALVPVLLRITYWTKSGLPVSPKSRAESRTKMPSNMASKFLKFVYGKCCAERFRFQNLEKRNVRSMQALICSIATIIKRGKAR